MLPLVAGINIVATVLGIILVSVEVAIVIGIIFQSLSLLFYQKEGS